MPSLSEQVAALEAERNRLMARVQEWREIAESKDKAIESWGTRAEFAERALVTAKVEGARACREAFMAGSAWELGAIGKRTAREEALCRYPAPASGEPHCKCWADRAPNEPCVCTPPSAPEPLVVRVRTDEDFLMQVMGKDAYISITPADATPYRGDGGTGGTLDAD